jgi:hypothetical protein
VRPRPDTPIHTPFPCTPRPVRRRPEGLDRRSPSTPGSARPAVSRPPNLSGPSPMRHSGGPGHGVRLCALTRAPVGGPSPLCQS